ncbi:MAG: LPP20 family lipoprotein [Nitrospira sp.]|nr:MAG: LPP20 family lipoprotein [Nitrospira sp.]
MPRTLRPRRRPLWLFCTLLLTTPAMAADATDPAHDREHYLIGEGQGDLGKGLLVCRRVAELAARADIAKQIRVLVKERAIDRVRERTGHDAEQDIEILREEVVQEYLQGVTLVERRTDEAQKTCSAVAIMPKNRLVLPSPLDAAAPDSPPRR